MIKTKHQAIKEIKRIQNGGGFDRSNTDVPKGGLAVNLWDDGRFTLGLEYGCIITLMRLFDIKPEDLQSTP